MTFAFRPAMGLDLSLTGAAVTVLMPNAPALIERWSTKPDGHSPRARLARYRLIWEPISELARQHQPGFVVVEGASFGSAKDHAQGYNDQVELRALVYEHVLPHCDELLEVAPSSLKCFAAGAGHADKPGVKIALEQRYGADFGTGKAAFDRADSFACAQLALLCAGTVSAETWHQERVRRLLLGLPPPKKPSKRARVAEGQGRLSA